MKFANSQEISPSKYFGYTVLIVDVQGFFYGGGKGGILTP